MFIYTIRASTIRFFSILLAALVLVGVIFTFAAKSATNAVSAMVDFSGIKTEEDRIEFIESQGYTVKRGSEESAEFSVPENFDRIISGYNQIQKSQGLDISKYKNKRVTRYTYTLENYEGSEDTVYVNLIVYKNTVIACDISSLTDGGFVKPLIKL